MANTTKVQPGLEAETAVIGALIYAPEIVKDVLFAVREQDFGIEINRKIFRAARDLYLRAKPVTAVTIRDKVGQESSDYLAQLYQLTMTSANWREYAAIMAEQASMRRMQEIAMQVAAAGTAQECRELAAKLQQEQSGGRQITAYTMEDMIRDFAARQTAKDPVRYVRYGLAEVDAGTYTQPGDVVIIGGYPSDGKTALALQMALRMAREWRVGFFSLETDRRKVTDRVVAALNDISFTAIKRRELTDKDWERFAAKSAAASALKFTLIEAAGWSVSDITSAAEAYDFDVVVIDYVQLIRPSSTRIMRSEQVAEISRELHAFAQSRKKLVIELAQLTREDRAVTPKKGKPQQNEPRMSDLKESGQLEQDADMIFMIYRPVEGGDYNPTTSRFLRIVKNKEGLLLRTLLWFDGDKQTFTPMTMTSAREVEEDKKLVERNARNERMSGAKRRYRIEGLHDSLHIHVFLRNSEYPAVLVRRLWDWGEAYDVPYTKKKILQEDGYRRLARYFTKERPEVGQHPWGPSRTLKPKVPLPEVKTSKTGRIYVPRDAVILPLEYNEAKSDWGVYSYSKYLSY